MASLFIIEDEFHAEEQGRYRSMAEAVESSRRLASIPWDQEPNCAPCTNWRTCHREYVLVEYDDSWQEIRRTPLFTISADGLVWADEFKL